MSVNITGLNQLLADLESRMGPAATERISDKALKNAAQIFVAELKKQFESFKNTGHSIREITMTEPQTIKGVRTITVHWKGPRNRYRIIHLNEYGTVKNPNPRGKGAIARALQASEGAYMNAIRDEIQRSL